MEPIGWALAAGIVMGTIGTILILLILLSEDRDSKETAVLCAFALLVVVSPIVMFSIGTNQGQFEYQGTPIDHLQIGREYNVLAMNVTNQNVYLTLERITDGKIILYERPLSDGLPKNLSVGDTILLTKENQLIITIDIYC